MWGEGTDALEGVLAVLKRLSTSMFGWCLATRKVVSAAVVVWSKGSEM